MACQAPKEMWDLQVHRVHLGLQAPLGLRESQAWLGRRGGLVSRVPWDLRVTQGSRGPPALQETLVLLEAITATEGRSGKGLLDPKQWSPKPHRVSP